MFSLSCRLAGHLGGTCGSRVALCPHLCEVSLAGWATWLVLRALLSDCVTVSSVAFVVERGVARDLL